jgi:endonuclease/exonuclease/phosphatase family metal-dependent hydrolase
VRIATFNILHGRTVGDGVDVDRLADCVRRLDADILALQEVDHVQERSGMADLTAVAAEAMGATSHRFVAAISGTPGATWMAATGDEHPDTAAYGIALLSRHPAVSWQVVRLPRIPGRFPMYLPGPNRVMVVDEEPRAAVIGQFDTPLGSVTVANTHLSFVPGWNRRQLRCLVQDLHGLPGPHVLVGDLNMTERSVARWSGMRPLAAAPTFPADVPTRQLDHVLTDDPRLVAVNCAAPLMPISDHRPLVVDVSASPRSDSSSADAADQGHGQA